MAAPLTRPHHVRPGPPGRPQGPGWGATGPGAGPAPPEPEIDREKVCPLLLRVFPRLGGHHQVEEYAVRGQEPKDEVQIYTWPDATLGELASLVKEVQPAAMSRNARLSFAFVYPDTRGRNVMKQVGLVHSSRPGDDDAKTLRSLRFQTGDFLDVAILT